MNYNIIINPVLELIIPSILNELPKSIPSNLINSYKDKLNDTGKVKLFLSKLSLNITVNDYYKKRLIRNSDTSWLDIAPAISYMKPSSFLCKSAIKGHYYQASADRILKQLQEDIDDDTRISGINFLLYHYDLSNIIEYRRNLLGEETSDIQYEKKRRRESASIELGDNSIDSTEDVTNILNVLMFSNKK